MTDVPGSDELAALLALVDDETYDDAIGRVCRLAAATVPACTMASVTVARKSGASGYTACASDDAARGADDAQHELHRGPCLDAARTGVEFDVADMAAETRWAPYPERALALGIRSSVSLPLFIDERPAGALNLFAPGPDAFREEDRERGRVLAPQVAIALTNLDRYYATRDEIVRLQREIAREAVVDRAVGVIIARTGWTEDIALADLNARARAAAVDVYDAADAVVAEASAAAGDRA